MKKVVSIMIKGVLLYVKGDNNNDIAYQLTKHSKGHYSGYMIKKSADLVESPPEFTNTKDKGVWNSEGKSLS